MLSDYKPNNIQLVNFIKCNNYENKMILSMRNHLSVRSCMLNSAKISLKDHKSFLSKLRENNNNIYWLVKDNNNILGVIYISKYDKKNKNGWLGIYKNPYLKVRGLGKILMKCLLDQAFNSLRLNTLKLEVFPENKKAINLYLKCGFKKEGLLREYIYHSKAGRQDLLIMGILRSEIIKKKV